MSGARKSAVEDKLGICCGATDRMRGHIHKTLAILRYRSDTNDTSAASGGSAKERQDSWNDASVILRDHLGGDTYSPMATVYLHYLDRLDLIEHGSGIAGSWLTSEGREVLDELDRLYGPAIPPLVELAMQAESQPS